MPNPAFITIPHLVRWATLGNPFMAKVAMILELSFIQVLEDSLLLFSRLFYALIEFVLRGVLYLLPPVLYHLGMTGTENPPALGRFARVGNLLGTRCERCQHGHNQQTKGMFHVGGTSPLTDYCLRPDSSWVRQPS